MADEQTAWQEGPSQAPVSGLQQETTGEATGEPPSLRQSGSSHLTSFVPVANNSLKVSVASPQKHGEGSGAFVTYLVSFSVLPVVIV